MSGNDDEEMDTQTQLLFGIASELTAIRRLLEAQAGDAVDEAGDTEDGDSDEETVVCRCGATFDSTGQAHRHARDEHNAPQGAEDDLIQIE